MPDDLKNPGAQDRARISMNEEHEVRYWTQVLGVSKEYLGSGPIYCGLVNVKGSHGEYVGFRRFFAMVSKGPRGDYIKGQIEHINGIPVTSGGSSTEGGGVTEENCKEWGYTDFSDGHLKPRTFFQPRLVCGQPPNYGARAHHLIFDVEMEHCRSGAAAISARPIAFASCGSLAHSSRGRGRRRAPRRPNARLERTTALRSIQFHYP